MPKKELSDDFMISDYGNWNVASDYARLKIMKHLYFADEYETIATFGYTDFETELNAMESPDYLKIKGFTRLIQSLCLIISNSKFAIKGTSKTEIENYYKELIRYSKTMELFYTFKFNQVTKTRELKIIKEKYTKALERVIEIKSLINEPLNKYDLIFTHKEELDPKKLKDAIKKGLIEVG